MLRYQTAGESHGKALIATMEGIPAQVKVSTGDIAQSLARRRLGVGRGARMKFEADAVEILAGVRHGRTLGSPVAVMISNTEWPKWSKAMSADAVPPEELEGLARNAPLTRPRPGHADLAGMQKYDFDEARPVLERASARETAARVALGRIAQNFLAQAFGITVLSHVTAIGAVTGQAKRLPRMSDLKSIDDNPVRCFDPAASERMLEEIAKAKAAGDTLGGVIEVLAWGCPPGLGSYSHSDRRIDAKLAGALMGIQAIKAVEIGDGFELAKLPGSLAHDEIIRDANGAITRMTQHSGGTEGGMTTGEVVRLRAAMKPIATVPRALRTIDVASRHEAKAHHQRSDVCAVPAAGVVAEAMVALVLAEAALEKFGGDSLQETKTNYHAYLRRIAERGLSVHD